MFCWRTALFILMTLPVSVLAQNTTGSLGGTVKTIKGEALAGASVKLVHEPTGTVYYAVSGKKGNFHIDNISPGGPYLPEASFAGFLPDKKDAVYINLGEEPYVDFRLAIASVSLKNITVSAAIKNNRIRKSGPAIFITKEKIENLPSAGRNLYDYLRAIPQARLSGGNEGAVSFAGQNNRYNAFYVDGALNNDVYGLTASGTNGGQSGTAPLSVDAIDQFQVALSPYDVSVGNFTGAGIHAITRSGTNQTEGSVYHFFSNRQLAGKAVPNSGQTDFATHLSGMRLQGAFTQNKLFYFMNLEIQRDRYPKPFDFSQYIGDTKDRNRIGILANTLRSAYHYDAGSFQDDPESVNADRVVMRLDWNMNKRNRLSVSNRYTAAQRINTNAADAGTIHFSNDGFLLNSVTNSTSIEWRSVIANNRSNKLIATFTSVMDDRGPLGKAFPRVRINDGEGAIIFGTDNSSTINLLTQKNWTLFDKYDFVSGKHHISLGLDAEYHAVNNAFIQNSFGNYTYASLGDFLTNQHPSAYQLGFSLVDDHNDDHTAAAAKFSVMKTALFINDEIRISDKFSMHFGIRADRYRFLNQPYGDDSINLVYLPAFSGYYDIQNTRSGAAPAIPMSVSPRTGFMYHNENNTIIIRGGAGIFSGRVPLAWPGGIYHNNGVFVGGYSANIQQLRGIRFRPDPYKQWTTTETAASINKEPLNLMSKQFIMPVLFRTSLFIDKKISKRWSVNMEAIFSKNLSEIKYTNINLLPPTDTASGPDNRFVYTAVNNGKIPLPANGNNPYAYVILLGNDKNHTGHAESVTASITGKTATAWNMEISYTLGRSTAVNEGTSSVNVNQWRLMETVNGRNDLKPSVSDFSTGHRIFAWISRQYAFTGKKMYFSISLTYTGQSGSPFSYVYGNRSMTRDDGIFGAYDLLYIPAQEELANMIFLPNTINGNNYTSQQQKDALETYLQNDPYLKDHRGGYAERNGSHTPFTHRVDVKLKQDIKLRIGRAFYDLQISFDIFNAGNLINPNWGFQYIVPFDHFALVDFAGYRGAGDLIPQYRFNPGLLHTNPWKINPSPVPAYASRWSSQLGLRLTFK